MIKAVVFDVDKTLTDDVSWLRSTELMGASVVEHEGIFRATGRGIAVGSDNQALLEVSWKQVAKLSDIPALLKHSL